MPISASALKWLAPSTCALCEAPLPAGVDAGVCATCREAFRPWACSPVPGTMSRRVCGAMDGPLRTALLRLKFHHETWRAQGIGRWMAKCHWPDLPPLERGTVVVPVPLSPSRLGQRGYNQAALLARALAWTAQLPWSPNLLQRNRELDALSRSSNRDARRAILGGYRAAQRVSSPVLLVDDVTTTGSTLEACAAALHEAGCPHVDTLCAAGTDVLAPPLTGLTPPNSES